ncbi:MAG TPA: R3H domain-containing nucleic acid-binding protein [Candidatus Baltobacteraceae bacterium]|jgi:spoIIIJ-associated protein|nr:R3H domain-containing nucleic acid-binding protein [Candidatus Baltobacteraceae bacterium]
MFEDDFELEDQPGDIRDRDVPGRSAPRAGVRRGPRPGKPERANGHAPRAPRERVKLDFPEDAKPARDLLQEILTRMGVPHAEIEYVPRPEGEYLEVTGPDLAMLIGRHGNTLEALNLIFNNILNVGVRNNRRYYTIDAEGYRARRADQLKNIALMMLERTIREKKPQRLEPMLPSERKIVHLALADNQYVRTESEGVEPERRVVVFPK